MLFIINLLFQLAVLIIEINLTINLINSTLRGLAGNMVEAVEDEFVPTISIAPLFGSDRDAKLKVAKQIDEVQAFYSFIIDNEHRVSVLFGFMKQLGTTV